MKQMTLAVVLLLGLDACGSDLLGGRSTTEGGVLGPGSVIDKWISEIPEERLRDQCAANHGTVIDSITVGACANAKAHLSISDGLGLTEQDLDCESGTGGAYTLQCVQLDADGRLYWQDGPSVPPWLQAVGPSISDKYDPSRWTYVAWDAAVNHDYCYHHNGITHGYSKDDCDQQFFSDLSAVCASDQYAGESWFSVDACRVNAAAMFAAVQVAGEAPWNIMNARVQYPAHEPQWQKLGLAKDVSDERIKDLAAEIAAAGASLEK